MSRRDTNKRASFLFAVAALAVIAATGCERITTEYGKTKGSLGHKSLNGFGALRNSYGNAGFRNRDVSRLSERVMRTDVIVWTPQVLGSVDTKATRWFERWLLRGNRTLVYVVPDSGSEADYWMSAARLAPPEQRLEYRRRAAKSITQRMMWRLNRGPVPSNGWFRIEPLVNRNRVGQTDGPWKKDLGKIGGDTEFSVEFSIVAFDADDKTNKGAAQQGFLNSGPTGPASPGWSFPVETTPSRTEVTCAELLRTGEGDPIVVQIRSKRWKDSSIIVVAGGSLLTNYALTRPWNRRLARQIIAESAPAGKTDLRAGFLTSDWTPIAVSELKPGVPKASGMELLTVWPMSLVTMHGVMLGLVICLMLFPIFGRPRRIETPDESDFGHHLDAVAALMNKAGGEQYARARISEYMKRMHGETSGPWVLPEAASQSAPKPLPSLTSKRFASTSSTSTPDQPSAQSDLFEDAPLGDITPIADPTPDEKHESAHDEPSNNEPNHDEPDHDEPSNGEPHTDEAER